MRPATAVKRGSSSDMRIQLSARGHHRRKTSREVSSVWDAITAESRERGTQSVCCEALEFQSGNHTPEARMPFHPACGIMMGTHSGALCQREHTMIHIPLLGLVLSLWCSPREDTDLEHARAIAKWLETQAIETEHGLTWPVDTRATKVRTTPNLYAGSAGVALFFLSLHAWTGEATHGQIALRACRELVARPGQGTGLYTGRAGTLFILSRAAEQFPKEGFDQAAKKELEAIARGVREDGSFSAVTDIISGSAGTGLALLDYHRRTDSTQALALAERAGDALIDAAVKHDTGLRWKMSEAYTREMPGFSHGTAGVAYFLAELHATTSKPRFLEAAKRGASALLALRSETGLLPHHLPGGEDLFYLGWCHGPVGTARLYQRLLQITGDERFEVARDQATKALTACKPPARTPGYWNNVGVCCGSAGIGLYYLDLRQLTSLETYDPLIDALAMDILARGTRSSGMLYFEHAEHRVKPDLLSIQTGLMQGAAGVGLFFLLRSRLCNSPESSNLEHETARKLIWIRLPDDPFGKH